MNQPYINGTRHSWSSISFLILGRMVTGIEAISYEEKQTKENHYGVGDRVVSRGRGNVEPTASVTLAAYEVDAIQKSLGIGKKLTDIAPFDIVVAFTPEGQDKIVTHTLRNCEFTNNKRDIKQGDTKIVVDLELILSEIIWM